MSVWGRRTWIPLELWPFCNNQHELLRRVGEPRLAGEDGTLLVAPGTVIAVESGELAGFATIGADAADTTEVRVDDRRWTIELRDDAGAPVAGMPIALEVDGAEGLVAELWQASLGLTDAQGRLVVRAPGGIDTPEFARWADQEIELTEPVEAGKSVEKKPEAPKPPPMTVRPSTEHRGRRRHVHAGPRCGPAVGRSASIRGPARHAARDHGRGPAPRLAWSGRGVGLSDSCGQWAAVRRDAVLALRWQARLHDAGGKPVTATQLDIRPAWPPFRICSVRTDRAGRFALVLCPGFAAGTRVTATVRGCVVPELLGAQVSFELEPLGPGDRRDIGILTLGSK